MAKATAQLISHFLLACHIGGCYFPIHQLLEMSDNEEWRDTTSPEDLRRGQKVGGGRFTLDCKLGGGGFGIVWRARDERLGRDVALKLLHSEIAADPDALGEFRRETLKSQILTHQNIIQIYDFYESPGEPSFISMEYLDGSTLQGLRLKQPQRCFAWNYFQPLVVQLCQALEYAHEEGVIHRDLKPANIMLNSRGRIKLADFGIAATVSTSGQISLRHHGAGTPHYMSPQQIQDEPPQVTDDIYSLGATLYELLTSRPPFSGAPAVVMNKVLKETPLSIEARLAELKIANEIPPHVSALIMSCLAKDGAHRPQSAREFLKRLQSPPTLINRPETVDDFLETTLGRSETMVPPPFAAPQPKALAPVPVRHPDGPTGNHPATPPPKPAPNPLPTEPALSAAKPLRDTLRFPALQKAKLRVANQNRAEWERNIKKMWIIVTVVAIFIALIIYCTRW